EQCACWRRQRIAGLEPGRIAAPQQVLRAQRLAAVRERDDDELARTDERGELRLGFRESACGDRRTLRLERERLSLRERVELGGAPERGLRDDAVLVPDLPYLVRLEDEIGNAVERGHELAGFLAEANLGRRIDDRLRNRVERALRERGERADRLDLVTEELDAERLVPRRREHVDEAAADCELPAVVDAVDARVAGVRERLRDRLDP